MWAGADTKGRDPWGRGSPFGQQLNVFCKVTQMIVITILILFFRRSPVLAPGSSFESWKGRFVVESSGLHCEASETEVRRQRKPVAPGNYNHV